MKLLKKISAILASALLFTTVGIATLAQNANAAGEVGLTITPSAPAVSVNNPMGPAMSVIKMGATPYIDVAVSNVSSVYTIEITEAYQHQSSGLSRRQTGLSLSANPKEGTYWDDNVVYTTLGDPTTATRVTRVTAENMDRSMNVSYNGYSYKSIQTGWYRVRILGNSNSVLQTQYFFISGDVAADGFYPNYNEVSMTLAPGYMDSYNTSRGSVPCYKVGLTTQITATLNGAPAGQKVEWTIHEAFSGSPSGYIWSPAIGGEVINRNNSFVFNDPSIISNGYIKSNPYRIEARDEFGIVIASQEIIVKAPSSVTIDGKPASLDVLDPEKCDDLTDDAKSTLPAVPHDVVVTYPTTPEPTTDEFQVMGTKPAEPVGVTIDGQPSDVSKVTPDGKDLTPEAKKDLPLGPHQVVVDLDDGTKETFTYDKTPTSVTIDGNPVNPGVVTPDGKDITPDAKNDLPVGPHTVVVTYPDGSKDTITVQGTKPTGNGNGNGSNNGKETGVAGFVERLYTIVLQRPSEPAGKAAWIHQLVTHANTGAKAAEGFFLSDEFLAKDLPDEDWLTICYRTFFDREPDAQGYAEWMAVLKSGESRDHVLWGFVNSNEWASVCWQYGIRSGGFGTPNTNGAIPENEVTSFVTRLYTTCLKRTADHDGVVNWSLLLINGDITGAEAAEGFFFSSEFTGKGVNNGDFVTRLYQTFMNRTPDTAGYNAWVGQLNGGASRNEVFNGFTGSSEWANLCAQSGIEPV